MDKNCVIKPGKGSATGPKRSRAVKEDPTTILRVGKSNAAAAETRRLQSLPDRGPFARDPISAERKKLADARKGAKK
jgi:hypothetical protein